MNNSSLERCIINISNGWIIGCSILTFGIITNAYLHGISNISLIHMRHKYKLELHQIEKANDSSKN